MKSTKILPSKNCPQCSITFLPKNSASTYCSRNCIQKNSNTLMSKRAHEKLMESVTNPVTCKICQYQSTSLQSHIQYQHKLTIHQYKEQYSCTTEDIYSKSYTKFFSDKIKGDANPAYQHDGKFSPFSEKFVKYDNMNSEDRDIAINTIVTKAAATRDQNDNNSTTIEYYLKRGMNVEDAAEALSQRQSTFSLEICIEKYGEEAGLERWKQRQVKWLNTLSKKSPQEIAEINRKKIEAINSGYSAIATELFDIVYDNVPKITECYYKSLIYSMNEKVIKSDDSWIKPDFIYGNKIIEFYGDYWHGNPIKYKGSDIQIFTQRTYDVIWNKDFLKNTFLKNTGYIIKIIWEHDYRNDKQKIINECVNFLSDNNEHI